MDNGILFFKLFNEVKNKNRVILVNDRVELYYNFLVVEGM